MGFEASHDRPIAALAAWAAIQGAPECGQKSGPYVPPIAPDRPKREDVASDLRDVCVGILRGVVLGEDLSPVRHRLAPDLVTWSPHLFAVTRDQLLRSIGVAETAWERSRQAAGETLSEVSLDAVDVSAAPGRVYVEWRLTVRFTSAAFIDDDLLIEPTGRLLETAGLQVISLDGDVVVAVHCYYDDLALFEQLLMSR